MRTTPLTTALALAGIALSTLSCSNGGGATRSDANGAKKDGATVSASASPSKAGAKSGRNDAPKPPAGAQYTIYCLSIPGDGHIPQATQLRDQLVRSTGMRDWYVVHRADESTLYYGYYRSIDRSDDAREAARARADREKIDAMLDASGGRPFRNALLVELASPDPEAPPQWDLRAAPPSEVWSLQVAAYEGHPDRKKYAVDAVKAFRDNGVPAYYYHGQSVSSVCIGTWPGGAVTGELEPGYNDPTHKRSMDEIASQSTADLLVVSPGLPPVNKEIRTKSGKLRAVSPHLEAVDPTLLATMKAYPHHYVNGVVEGVKTAQGLQGKPSMLVKIPRQPKSMLDGGYDATVAGGTAPRPAADPGSLSGLPPGLGAAAVTPVPAGSPSSKRAAPPPQPPPQGYGRLRSLEDR